MNILITVLLALFQQTTTSQPGPTPLPNNNPYCGQTAASFPAPQGPVNCPSGQTANEDCVESCRTSYGQTMLSASKDACSSWNTLYSQYSADILEFTNEFIECTASAGNTKEVARCRRVINRQVAQANVYLKRAQGLINDFMDTTETNTASAFWLCATACCEVPEDVSVYGLEYWFIAY